MYIIFVTYHLGIQCVPWKSLNRKVENSFVTLENVFKIQLTNVGIIVPISRSCEDTMR